METIPQPRMTILKIAVVVMGILLVAGFALVAITIVKRASNPEAAAAMRATAGQFGNSLIGIAPGETVKSVTMNEDRLAIHLTGAGGEAIVLVNIRSGREIGRLHLRPQTDLAAHTAD